MWRTSILADGHQYAILGGDWSPFWHDLIDMVGMESIYLKMCPDPELIDTIIELRFRSRLRLELLLELAEVVACG